MIQVNIVGVTALTKRFLARHARSAAAAGS